MTGVRRVLRGFLCLGAATLGLAPSALLAQFHPTDPGQVGTAFSSGAFARGWGAVGVNPGALGLPDGPRASLAIPTLAFRQTLQPLGWGDVTPFGGSEVPRSEREHWIRRIEAVGGQEGSGSAQLAGVAGSWGPVGFQHTTTAWADARLNPAAAELVLFGNAGRTGEPGDFELEGSRLDVGAFSTFSVAAAYPFGRDEAAPRGFALGLGLRFLVAHGLVMGRDLGSLVGADPVAVELRFPLVTPTEGSVAWDRGRGVGLDLGGAWSVGPWTGFLAVQDVLNSFRWDLAQMEFRAGTAVFQEGSGSSDFEPRPLEEAPEALRTEVEELTFRPAVTAGAGYAGWESLRVSAQLRHHGTGGIRPGPRTELGAGAEWRGWSMVPLRAGAAYTSEGVRVGGGAGLDLGPVSLSAALLHEGGPRGSGRLFSLGLSGALF